MRLTEPSRKANLGEKALGAQYGREFGPQNLERHLAIVAQIARQLGKGQVAMRVGEHLEMSAPGRTS